MSFSSAFTRRASAGEDDEKCLKEEEDARGTCVPGIRAKRPTNDAMTASGFANNKVHENSLQKVSKNNAK